MNKKLLKTQKVTKDQEENLNRLYTLLEDIFSTAKELQSTNNLDHNTGSIISNTIRDIEFMLQKNWNLDQDENKHSYQNKLPGCLCGSMDNQDIWGTGIRWVNQKCPYHSKGEPDVN